MVAITGRQLDRLPPNPRLQRTPSASPPSPPSRQLLGGFRKGAVSRLLFVGLLGLQMAGSRAVCLEPPETFGSFLDRFLSEKQFRLARIRYPLIARLGSSCEGDLRVEKWSRAKTQEAAVRPMSPVELAAEGLTQRIKKVSAHRVEVFQFREEADSHLVTYRFELKGSAWYLTWFEDRSC